MAWLTNWNRRKSKIINGSTTLQTNYQMRLTVHKGSGTDTTTDIYLGTNVRDDFGDVRFTKSNGSDPLNYWMDSSTLISGTSVTFWIQIDSIPVSPSTTTIYVYYDNTSQTTTSNGTNTFDAFDLTTFTLYNPDGLLTVNSASKVSWDGNLYMSHSYLSHPISSRSDFIADFEYGDGGAEHAAIGFADSLNDMSHVTNGVYAEAGTPGGSRGFYIERYTSGTSNWFSGPIYYGSSINYMRFTRAGNVVTLHAFSDSARTIEISGSPITYTDTSAPPVTYFYAISGKGFPSGVLNQTGYVQNVRVRKYSSPEPTFGSSGVEETPALITATYMEITTSQTPCLQGICTVTATVTWTNQGTATGSFVPSLTIDGTPIVSPYPSEDLGAGANVTHAFDITNLATGDRTICPSPN